MRACPNCGAKIGFLTFVFRYGSDSLVRHSSNAHRNEHACIKCGHKIWIYHNPFKYRNLAIQCALGAVLFSWAVAFLVVKPEFNLSVPQAILSAAVVFGAALPLGLSIAKYFSASFKEER